jgi:hypothetical protein
VANTAIVDTLQNMIRADLGNLVYEILPTWEVDPFFRGLGLTSKDVGRFSNISQGWLIRKVLSSGLAGQFKWDAPFEDVVADNTGATPVRSHTLATKLPSSRYPAATNLPLPAIIQVSIPLAKGRGTIAWPSEYLRLDKLDAALTQYTEISMKSMAKTIAINQANSFFAPMNGAIATVGTIVTSPATYDASTSGTTQLSCSITSGGRIFQFEDGMLVDIYYLSSGSENTSAVWAQRNVDANGTSVRGVVDGVDWLGGTLRIIFDSTLAAAVTAGDHIILADTFVDDATSDYARTGPLGINNMIRSASYDDTGQNASTTARYVMSPNGSSSYGFNLAKYPKFGSYIKYVNGVLDETSLNQYLGRFFDATGLTLDTVVTTRAVINKFAEYPLSDGGRQVFQRQGAGLKFTSGRDKVDLTYEGREWELTQSRFCPPGTLYGLKKKGNYSIAVPPTQPDATQKDTELGPPIEFIGQSLGYASDFIPVLANNTHVDMVQAPFQMFYQIVCQTPQGIKLTGITEDASGT